MVYLAGASGLFDQGLGRATDQSWSFPAVVNPEQPMTGALLSEPVLRFSGVFLVSTSPMSHAVMLPSSFDAPPCCSAELQFVAMPELTNNTTRTRYSSLARRRLALFD